MKKGDRITITGHGRTGHWPKNTVGTVTKKRGARVFVHWDKTHFEDELHKNEVKLLEE